MPEQSYHTIKTQLSDTMMQAYKELAEDNVLWTGKATINAVHAGVLTKKLLQAKLMQFRRKNYFDDMERYCIFSDLGMDLPRACTDSAALSLEKYRKNFLFSTALGLDDKEIDKSCYNHNENDTSCHKEIVFDFEVS